MCGMNVAICKFFFLRSRLNKFMMEMECGFIIVSLLTFHSVSVYMRNDAHASRLVSHYLWGKVSCEVIHSV